MKDRLPNAAYHQEDSLNFFLNDYWNCNEIALNICFQDILNLWNKLDCDVPKFCNNESQLQNRWINRIFECLGWSIEVNEASSNHGVTNFPDYTLYKDFNELSKSKNLTNKFKSALSVADAKAWGVNLDGKGFTNKNPSYQIINYLRQTEKSWGVLTDGRYWRIYSTRSESKHSTYYEIDLVKLLRRQEYEDFKYFFNFFKREAFESRPNLSDKCFLDIVFENGKSYSRRIENNLGERIYKVVHSICNGFLETHENKKVNKDDLKDIYEHSMYYIFKLLFVLNSESKGLLCVNITCDYYIYSLRKKCLEIKNEFEEGRQWLNQARTYDYINKLFDILKRGSKEIGVHGFGNDPFEIGKSEYYLRHKLPDNLLNQALLDLAFDYDGESNLQSIDYKTLSPDHIGSLFEKLLEYEFVQKINKIELINTKDQRKTTASYYTPEYMVDYIVKETLADQIEGKSPGEILELKILDNAMGSGHFLLGAVRYLENAILKIQHSDSEVKNVIPFENIKNEIIKNCIFGIDKEPLATQLAKFSLWIYSSQTGDRLQPLSDHLITHNSLLDDLDYSEKFNSKISKGNIDAIICNPPYIGEKGNKEIFHTVKGSTLGKRFYQGKMDYFYFFFHKSLDLLKENGSAGFISTNYFVTASGASKLRKDLKERAQITGIVNFGDLKIFKGAKGQHNQVTFFKKGSNDETPCAIYRATTSGICDKDTLSKILSGDTKYSDNFEISISSLFDGEENYIRTRIAEVKSQRLFKKMIRKGNKLGDICCIDTGIQTGADKLTDSHIKKYGKIGNKGDGIFVLTREELKTISLSQKEEGLVFNFYKNSDVKKYSSSENTSEVILYLDRGIMQISNGLKNHFNQFEKILKRIGEVRDGKRKWFSLHRARKRSIFTGEKILAPQRSQSNTFGYNKGEWFGATDIFFITSLIDGISLKYILGAINSKTFYYWLFNKGKRKGSALELIRTPLAEMMVPKMNEIEQNKVIKLTEKLIENPDDYNSFHGIDELLYKFYAFTELEISQIETLYRENHRNQYIYKNNVKVA